MWEAGQAFLDASSVKADSEISFHPYYAIHYLLRILTNLKLQLIGEALVYYPG